MLFLANRANLDRRRLLTRLHNTLDSRAERDASAVETVWYHTSAGNKVGVRATVDPVAFYGGPTPSDEAELQVSFDFPPEYEYDFYKVQWVEPERSLMVGWHQDETHEELGECHFQVDHDGRTVQRESATYLDSHPLNVFDQRTDDLVDVLDALTWSGETPSVPTDAIP
jgi:hypothetical protein